MRSQIDHNKNDIRLHSTRKASPWILGFPENIITSCAIEQNSMKVSCDFQIPLSKLVTKYNCTSSVHTYHCHLHNLGIQRCLLCQPTFNSASGDTPKRASMPSSSTMGITVASCLNRFDEFQMIWIFWALQLKSCEKVWSTQWLKW